MLSHRAIWGLIAVLSLVSLALPVGSAAQGSPRTALPRSNVPIANGELRTLVVEQEAGIQGPSHLQVAGESVRVEILHQLSSTAVRNVVSDLGGEVYGEVPGVLVEALVPVDRLLELEATDGVDYVQPPQRVDIPIGGQQSTGDASARPQGDGAIIGQEIEKTNADAWHDAGYDGDDVHIGIIDGFDGDAWGAAQAAGEVPTPSGTFCKAYGQGCSAFAPHQGHGVAVAEIIHEMAPKARLYLAVALTASDLIEAVDYFADHDVTIISRSLTSEYDGPGDGTGATAAVVDYAASQGMLWINAAGNAASPDPTGYGSYWRGTWNDPDANDIMNFQNGEEALIIQCGFLNGLRWDDWTGGATDYDVLIFDDFDSTFPKAFSINYQTEGAPPLELTDQMEAFTCTSALDLDLLVILLADPGDGATGDTLELMGNGIFFELSQNLYSASGPVVDSANPAMLSVGAIDPWDGSSIAEYSSQGPTNDGRKKPDISAASCVSSFLYYPDCFSGTSAAAPTVTGAAALILSSGFASTAGAGPNALAQYLLTSTIDHGDFGADNIYGIGELVLPDPGPIVTPTPAPTLAPGQLIWGDHDCDRSIAPRDGQAIMKQFLGQSLLSQQPGCPSLAASLTVASNAQMFGDTDCNGAVAPRDGQAVLKVFLQQAALSQTQPCPVVGAQVSYTE